MSQQLEASFSLLVTSLASSAAVALGLTPDPQSGQSRPDKALAKFNIDLLLVLQDKTKGNRSTDEDRLLTMILTDLQSRYLSLKEDPKEQQGGVR